MRPHLNRFALGQQKAPPARCVVLHGAGQSIAIMRGVNDNAEAWDELCVPPSSLPAGQCSVSIIVDDECLRAVEALALSTASAH